MYVIRPYIPIILASLMEYEQSAPACPECERVRTAIKKMLGWREQDFTEGDKGRQVIEYIESIATAALRPDAEGMPAPECRWQRTTPEECEYRNTHHYCPHPEHACDCGKR